MIEQSQNRFLGTLSVQDRSLLTTYLERVELRPRERLEMPGRAGAHAYFMEAGLASVMSFSKGRRTQSEVALIGREGIVGLTAIVGLGQSLTETTMLTDGRAFRISGPDFKRIMSVSSSLQAAVLRYVYIMWLQTSSTALASAQGTISQRLARWILMATNRIEGRELLITHQSLAFLIGVRRASVTLVLDEFEKSGLLLAGRGHIAILNRDRLVEASGGFYGACEADYENLLNAHEAGSIKL